MKKEFYGKTGNEEVSLFTLKNSIGTEVQITNFGCIITKLKVADKEGAFRDIVLGFNSFEEYLGEHPYLGAAIGRFSNRISNAKFSLGENNYELLCNEEETPNHLHGGEKGFDKILWSAEDLDGKLVLTYISPDGEEGYPGNLTTKVIYSLTEANEFTIEYEATTDKDTVINFTNHSYFNLNGDGSGDILSHELSLEADAFTPTDSFCVPTGEIRKVEGTAFDFRTPHTIGERIENDEEQLNIPEGYDINFVLNKNDDSLTKAALLTSKESGISMEVYTTEPGIQVYTMNGVEEGEEITNGKNGTYYGRQAICLETQHFPDSPNIPSFPSTELKAGETYKSKTIYKFI